MARIFLLSPAHCGGERARMAMNPRAQFPLAVQLGSDEGAPLGEVFRFLSGLYFRGKLAYAHRFAEPPPGVPGVLVITTNRGLLPADTPITRQDLVRFGEVDILGDDLRYLRPLLRDARALKAAIRPDTEVILLGSVATGKYVEPLLGVFGEQLRFPRDFVGRGDMSRGGLLLRAAREDTLLDTVNVQGAVRTGPRAPRLTPRRR